MKKHSESEIKHGSIQICMSGHVHLHFGNATLHLSVEQFRSFLDAAEDAFQEFEDRCHEIHQIEERRVTH